MKGIRRICSRCGARRIIEGGETINTLWGTKERRKYCKACYKEELGGQFEY
jgi:hypothetical protein